MHTDAGDGDGPSTLHAGPQASRPAPLALRWCRAGCEGQPALAAPGPRRPRSPLMHLKVVLIHFRLTEKFKS